MQRPERLPYGQGIFRRRFLLVGSEGRVVADMEDDFHRFHVELRHDGRRVIGVESSASRYPWSECPGAIEPLRALEGLELSPYTTVLAKQTNPRDNCTHLFDIAALAVTHAEAGRGRRCYDITIPDRDEGHTHATLHRDGELLLDWEVQNTRILGPAPFTGIGMRGSDFLRWAEGTLEPEVAEAAIILRRATFISVGRAHDLDQTPNAAIYLPLAGSSCYSFTKGIAERAERMLGTTWEFTDGTERLLADVEDAS